MPSAILMTEDLQSVFAVQLATKFFKMKTSAGILLMLAAIVALIMANTGLDPWYDSLLTTPVVIQIGDLIIDKPLLLWINDGLMAVFFLLVGLEIKREIMIGKLSSREQLTLPAVAAFGGLLVPGLIYAYINWHDPVALHGWAIPVATDIAFALGVLMLLGDRVPPVLKVALVAIAILDDLAAIIIIALFYASDLSIFMLAVGVVAIAALVMLNRANVTRLSPYILIGVFLWVCVLKSGVHATLAGVVLAFIIPLKIKNDEGQPPLKKLEHALHPWVTFGVLPLFVFANAGVTFGNLTTDVFLQPITVGIAVGLFIGKQIGVMGATLIGVATRICKLPEGVTWTQYWGIALLTGMGFTMSLFIGTLAFSDIERTIAVRLGVFIGSLLAGGFGYWVLRATGSKKKIFSDPDSLVG